MYPDIHSMFIAATLIVSKHGKLYYERKYIVTSFLDCRLVVYIYLCKKRCGVAFAKSTRGPRPQGSPEYQRLYTDFLSEELTFAYHAAATS